MASAVHMVRFARFFRVRSENGQFTWRLANFAVGSWSTVTDDVTG
jgi:hypothetical protein